jgi:glutathione S-transferase
MMSPLKLYFFPDTCARVALTALEQSGASFETQLIKLPVGEHHSPEYLKLNPKGKLPTLQVGDWVLTENMAILSWLARAYPAAGILPAGANLHEEFEALSDLSWCASSIHPLVTQIVVPQLFCDTPEGIERVWALGCQSIAWHLQIVERRLRGQSWMRAECSAIDWYLEWIWSQIVIRGFDPAPFPKLAEHSARVCALPASQRARARERQAVQWLISQGFPAGPPPRPAKS